MNEIRLPALDGRSPLGMLAAFGVLRLLEVHAGQDVRLSWSADDFTAVLHTASTDVGEVATDLVTVAQDVQSGSVLPGVLPGFPPPGAAPDRLRVQQRELAHDLGPLVFGAGRLEVAAWLGALVTDLGADDRGRVAISQYTAPSGKQSMSTMLTKPLEQVLADPDVIRQGLEGWRRMPGVTGEYLDHRAMWDATEAADGATGVMRGVPGATWLALMALPMLRTTWSPLGRPMSSGWHVVRRGRSRVDELRLPVFTMPATVAGVVSLIEHPAMAPARARPRPGASSEEQRRAQVRAEDTASQTLRRLGVVRVCRARRWKPAGSKSAGVLRPEGQ